ncbi:hypothetical protein SAMN05421823_10360 [Catalinimonas alkaloidigena]|uniref:Uncharacterized protein n=1 Tax=Catalinimonas alkaloidigena TaxID=1075417 RepID=A0A1G9DB96_9BACT|nr:hypothetical protein [Catalinimonas alkaloidigena]SDK61085.1 hypothetical protein SAMN05421823_10360 [Catalinimonas alkaloidigena]
MKLKISALIVLVLTLGTALPSYAQDAEASTEEASNTLNAQFESLKKSSNRYEDYKVVKEFKLNALWKNVQDSVQVLQTQIGTLQQQLASQEQELQDLKGQLAKRGEELERSERQNATISFLGMDVLKETYSTVMWSIVGILLVLMLGAIYKFQSSNKVTTRTRREYEALNEEFEEFRKRSREREIKIKRELQTERNHLEELRQKISYHNKI